MADIQPATAEIRRRKKEERRKKKKKKPHDENIMVGPIPYGDHNKCACTAECEFKACSLRAFIDNDTCKRNAERL